MSGETHSFNIVGDVATYRSASWLLTRDRWLWRRLLITFGVLWLLYTFLDIAPDFGFYGWNWRWMAYQAGAAFAVTLGLLAFCLALCAVLVPRRVAKMHRKTEKLISGTRFEFDAAEFRSSNPIATTRLEWGKFERWRENDCVVVLIVMERSYFVLPKSQIAPETLAALRAALIAAHVPTR